ARRSCEGGYRARPYRPPWRVRATVARACQQGRPRRREVGALEEEPVACAEQAEVRRGERQLADDRAVGSDARERAAAFQRPQRAVAEPREAPALVTDADTQFHAREPARRQADPHEVAAAGQQDNVAALVAAAAH